jgi:hypothetical protein
LVADGPEKDPLLLASVEVWAGPQPLPASPGVDPQKNRRTQVTPNYTIKFKTYNSKYDTFHCILLKRETKNMQILGKGTAFKIYLCIPETKKWYGLESFNKIVFVSDFLVPKKWQTESISIISSLFGLPNFFLYKYK